MLHITIIFGYILSSAFASTSFGTTQNLDPLSIIGIISGIGIFLSLLLLIYLIFRNNAKVKRERVRENLMDYVSEITSEPTGNLFAPIPKHMVKFGSDSDIREINNENDESESKAQKEFKNDEITVL
jgi:hypothetical protein